MLLISPHKQYLFTWNVPNTWQPQLVLFFLSGIWLPCRGGNENPSSGNLHILLILIPVSYLSTLTEVHSLPVYGIISWCPIHRIQVASDSAIGTSWFWSASRACFIWQFNVLWACLKITMDSSGIEPKSNFSPGFRLKFASLDGNTGVNHINLMNLILK